MYIYTLNWFLLHVSVYNYLSTACGCLPCWDRLRTLQCSAGPKEEQPAGPRPHNSLQPRCGGLSQTQGTQRHLKARIGSHDQRDIIDSSKTFISSESLITIHTQLHLPLFSVWLERQSNYRQSQSLKIITGTHSQPHTYCVTKLAHLNKHNIC